MKVSDVFLPIVEGPEDQLMSRFSRILKFDPRKTKYYQATKKIITPRFLNELIIPQDIFSVLAKLKLSDNQDEKVFRFILAASIFNGIFIGLPGTVGWGVIVSQIIEFIMATQIAYMVGLVPTLSNISVKKITDTITAAGIAGFTVLIVFEQVLKIIFNLAANIVPVGFATASAEIVTTLFYGLFIYLAFLEIKNLRNGQKLSLSGIGRIGANAATYTKSISVSL